MKRLDDIESCVNELRHGCDKASGQLKEAERGTSDFLQRLEALKKERCEINLKLSQIFF